MPAQNIKNTLNKLHVSLEKIKEPDQELLALLKQLDEDIRQILASDNEDKKEDSTALMDRVRSIGARFATDHPHLEPIMRELADTLGKMGI